MGKPLTVDVREMLCAQALAHVSEAAARMEAGAIVTVLYSTEDVKHDLLVWSTDRGYRLREAGTGHVSLERSS